MTTFLLSAACFAVCFIIFIMGVAVGRAGALSERARGKTQRKDTPIASLSEEKQREILLYVEEMVDLDETITMSEVHARWGVEGVRFFWSMADSLERRR